MFQSTPAITDGRRGEWLCIGDVKTQFQSTPAITDGRRQQRPRFVPRDRGFNPRPPSLTGDALVGGEIDRIAQFQSTPAITDGRRHNEGGEGYSIVVSIHARHH